MRSAATPRWLGLLRAAVTAILVVLFGAGTASAAAAPVPETRLGAHAVHTQGVVGTHRDVCADRWLGNNLPTCDSALATGVAAGDAGAAVPRLALEYVYDGGGTSYDASARLVDVRTLVHVDGAGRPTNAMSLRRQSGAVLHGSVSVSGFVVAAKAVDDILPTPQVGSAKLQNIANNLYKGTTNPNRVGNGTTMDAIRNELAAGVQTGNKWHSIKGQELLNGLNNWLRRNPGAPYSDRLVAQSLADELSLVLRGAAG